MAKLSLINNNKRKKKIIQSKKTARDQLLLVVKDRNIGFDEKIAAVHKLAEMPRNSSPTRYRNRCELSGRPRGFYRKFSLSRIALRELANSGMIPGVLKSSW